MTESLLLVESRMRRREGLLQHILADILKVATFRPLPLTPTHKSP